jgi:hypothetical protein
MIKHNELRIGNVIMYEEASFDINSESVKSISQLKVTAVKSLPTKEKGEQFYKDIKPVPLDKKWLLKFGFEIYKYRANTFGLNGYSFDLDKMSLHNDLPADCNKINEIDLKYIHQLQNLYFALTGNDLIYEGQIYKSK